MPALRAATYVGPRLASDAEKSANRFQLNGAPRVPKQMACRATPFRHGEPIHDTLILNSLGPTEATRGPSSVTRRPLSLASPYVHVESSPVPRA